MERSAKTEVVLDNRAALGALLAEQCDSDRLLSKCKVGKCSAVAYNRCFLWECNRVALCDATRGRRGRTFDVVLHQEEIAMR